VLEFRWLPKLMCPDCWPYAGILSAAGLGFLISVKYLLPLNVAFLAITVFALRFRASRRHGYGPFWVGLAPAAVILAGKFYFDAVEELQAIRDLESSPMNYLALTRDDEPPGVIVSAVNEWILAADDLESLFTHFLFYRATRSVVAASDLMRRLCVASPRTSIDNHKSAS
jgi:hypothetical protein